MIPREILKQIRQIEIRTNRIVTEFTEERARPGRSQRRPRRWLLRDARVQTGSPVPPRNVRREGAPNRSRGGCAPRELVSCHSQSSEFRVHAAWTATAIFRLKAELQTMTDARRKSPIVHHASRRP